MNTALCARVSFCLLCVTRCTTQLPVFLDVEIISNIFAWHQCVVLVGLHLDGPQSSENPPTGTPPSPHTRYLSSKTHHTTEDRSTFTYDPSLVFPTPNNGSNTSSPPHLSFFHCLSSNSTSPLGSSLSS